MFVVEAGGSDHYGFPAVNGAGFKVGRMNHPGGTVDPDNLDRSATSVETDVLRSFVAQWFPDGAGPMREAVVCMFTNTADRHFVLDLHTDEPNVVICSACSGHGFKFAPVVGEILAELAVDGSTRHEIDFLRLGRLL